MKAIRIRCEYLKDPIGIDMKHPRLMWNCEGGMTQTAYQVVCYDVDALETVLWDSGKVASSAMQAVYPKELVSGQKVVYKILLWDEEDLEGEWSQEASFEMGLLAPADWKAKWITGDYVPKKPERYPVDCFRKCFELSKDKNVLKARLYMTACGDYEAVLNGSKVGDLCFTPGHTDYRKRVQVQAYDVTTALLEGVNEMTVQLADGWYRGGCGAWGSIYWYGSETKLLAQLLVTYEDGTTDLVVSDNTWDWSNNGPIRFADHKDGEIVDALRCATYAGKAKETSHNVVPTASNNVPVREHEHFHPVITDAPNGAKILDFGQNIAGYVAFTVKAKAGQKITLRFGEMLDEEGNLTLKNIQLSNKKKTTPLQQIEYICKEGLNEYKTRFAVFGFQYAELVSDVEFSPEDIEAIAVYSDMERTGWFESSNELLNKFFEATVWSTKGNHLEIPTDCPTRERHGWTGDAQIFYNTAAFLFDFATFGQKYMHDMYDWQRKDGRLPHIAPDGGADFYMYTMNGSVGWSDAGILIPYRMWKRYGDKVQLFRLYEGMKRYAQFMMRRCGTALFAKPVRIAHDQQYLVNKGQSYGEWLEPNDVCAFNYMDFSFPHPEESTAYTSYVMGLMAEIAEALGHTEDAEKFREYHEGCKRAYQALVEKKEFSLDTDRQAKLVRPLYFDLLDPAQKEYARFRLLQAMEHYGWRLGTGFLSTPFILYVLCDIDPKSAYRLLENEEIPGWLSMPKNGATTIWEGWEGPKSATGVASLNHYSKGALCEWLFDSMCGIQIDLRKGEGNHFIIAPVVGGHFTFAKATYQSQFGLIKSGWERKDGKVTVMITVPSNCICDVVLPNGEKQTVLAGEHVFSYTE